MLQKLKMIVFQDIENENETKTVSVILRLNSIIMCIYFLCLLGIFLKNDEIETSILCIPCFFAYIFSFYTTYLNKTRLAVFFSQFIMVIWIISFILEFGWDCGVQHFIFVLLVLSFTVIYGKLKWKVVMSVAACILRLTLYAYTNVSEPGIILGRGSSVMFQIINTVFIFIAITVILMIFTRDSQEMEKKLVVYNEKLHVLASLDPLTGLLNRRSMSEYLEKKEKEYRKGNMEHLSIALGDIDFFKKINDTYGHECGDIVLKQLAAVFKECLSGKGAISRWGGEEFLFALNRMNGDEALVILSKMQDRLREMKIPYGDEVVKVTMTFGLSEFDFMSGIDASVNEVDKKLYRGKEAGRNRIVY